MMMKYGDVTENIMKYLNELPEDFLDYEAIVLTNGKWEVHFDYTGENPTVGLEDLKFFINYKKDLISKIITSEKPSQILGVAYDISEYFKYRSFDVYVGARNVFLTIWLKLQVFTAQILP